MWPHTYDVVRSERYTTFLPCFIPILFILFVNILEVDSGA